MTTSAPAARSFDASAAIVGASGAIRSPCTLAARVNRSASIVITPTMPTLTPAASTSTDGRTFGHSTGRPGRSVNQVRREEGISRLGGARLERAARVARQLSRRRRVDRPEIEIVVADGLRGVSHRVVRVDDEGALAEIRLDVALKRIAGVEQQDRAAVGRPGRAQVVHVAREQRQAAEAISRQGRPVEIAGADNRQGHKRRSIGSGTETGEARRPDQADEQQPKPAWHRPPGGYTRLPRWPFAHRDC